MGDERGEGRKGRERDVWRVERERERERERKAHTDEPSLSCLPETDLQAGFPSLSDPRNGQSRNVYITFVSGFTHY